MSSGSWRASFEAVALVLLVAGCGGGIDGTGAQAPTIQVTSSGVLSAGGLVLNNTRFDASKAIVTDDRQRNAAQLASGMVIKLRGRSDDGLIGEADRIDVENEARGRIQTMDATANPPRFTVAGLTVLVNSRTVYAAVANFAALAVDMRVEVHGFRNATGQLDATRIEAIGAQDGADEMRGQVGNVDQGNDRFTINGNLTVDYAAATFSPAGASKAALNSGAIVEVRGTLAGNVFTATQVDIEVLEDQTYQGEQGENQDVGGLISGFSVHPGTFRVNGRTVQTTAATSFVGGVAVGLANNVFVEIEGTINAQDVLVATKVKFEQNGGH